MLDILYKRAHQSRCHISARHSGAFKMKLLIVIASLVVLQAAWAYPVEDETPACDEVFRADVCEKFDALDDEVHDEEERERRQAPGLDKALIEQLLLKKLQFLINIGFLKNIPLIGQAIHQMVENDPEGVAKALGGGIFGLIQLGLKVLAIGGGLGR